MNETLSGSQFLHGRDSTLHTSPYVEWRQAQLARGERSQKPAERISSWLEVLEQTHGHNDPDVLRRIEETYHREYVIKPEDVPDSYFANLKRLSMERGEGDIEITEDIRNMQTEIIISDQESSLNKWISYLTSEDSSSYPTWAKYWAFMGMLKISRYDKVKKAFGERTPNTVSPFPDLNREALAYVIDIIQKKVNKENVDNEELEKLLRGSDFGKYYSYAIEKVTPASKAELLDTKGEWIRYDKGTDHIPLVRSLEGHGTGWCTAAESTAETQLRGGDFYVYYSRDDRGENSIPRIAIRMEGDRIGEIRGIAEEQNIDLYVGDVLENKLKEFGHEGDFYKKRVDDMKRVTEISRKEILSKEDLRFLYEVDDQIVGFGYEKDPRIGEIIKGRDIKGDISFVLDCRRDQISITEEEALSGDIKFHYGDLYLSRLKSAKGLKLPETIGGYLDLRGLKSAEGLKLPERIEGDLDLRGLKSAEGLKLPETIGGYLDLSGLKSTKGLELPERIGGSLDLDELKSADGLKFPETIVGYLDLRGLKSADGLELPERIGGSLDLDGLQSADGLELPKTIGGSLDLRGLKSADGLKLPETIVGYLDLSGLQSAEGLKLPKIIVGYLDLGGLKSTNGLKLPERIGGSLDLSRLKSAEGLKLPETIGGDLDLRGLQSVERDKLMKAYPRLDIL